VLLYWLGVGVAKIFGLNIWSLRAVNALLAVLGCLFTYFTAKKLYDRKTGIIAACVLATSMLYFILAHMYTMDLTITVFMEITLFSFILGVTHPKQQFFYFIIAAISTGFAVLAKGLMGIVLPLMIIGLWLSIFRAWKLLKLKEIITCVSIFLMITLPWHLVVAWLNPEFLHFYFMDHHFSRFSSGEVGHLRPFWYYLPVLLMGLFPWVVFLPNAIIQSLPVSARQLPDKKISLFFSLYAISIFLFFSISKAKLIPYILPIFPPLAIVLSVYLKNTVNLKKNYLALSVFSVIFMVGGVAFTKYWEVADLVSTHLFLSMACIVALTGSLIGYFFAAKKPFYSILSTIIMGGILGILSILIIPKMDRLTIYPLTQILKPILTIEDEVIAFNHHYQDLSFYLARKVDILNSRKLFAFGMQHQKAHAWMIEDVDLTKLWESSKRVFAIMDKEQYENLPARYQHLTFYLWGQTSKNVLVSNVALV
ncbi:MAG TPA: glycosyltransferase family 39 protein, partial [Gammaproteobacteria bacterium]|nr:glycosyltransferase family 39 protein [Gammaproteobacteria bacterium]